MIVKVQLPLASNAATPPALVYQEGKKDMRFVDPPELPRNVVVAVAKGGGKAFFYATITKGDRLVFGVEAPMQEW